MTKKRQVYEKGMYMKVTWLGQAGLLFNFAGVNVMIDPYLSNSVAKVNQRNERRYPVDVRFFDIRPDVLILTHNHLDHTDPETLERLLGKHSGICVLASYNAWQQARQYGGEHNYVSFNRGSIWTEKGIRFEAVYAEHSDDFAIGVVITYQGKNYYVAGDTLYSKYILKELPQQIEIAFLPVNGVGNNMNMTDAAQFAKEIGAKKVVPIHFGLFDNLNPKEMACKNKVIPQIYEEILL